MKGYFFIGLVIIIGIVLISDSLGTAVALSAFVTGFLALAANMKSLDSVLRPDLDDDDAELGLNSGFGAELKKYSTPRNAGADADVDYDGIPVNSPVMADENNTPIGPNQHYYDQYNNGVNPYTDDAYAPTGSVLPDDPDYNSLDYVPQPKCMRGSLYSTSPNDDPRTLVVNPYSNDISLSSSAFNTKVRPLQVGEYGQTTNYEIARDYQMYDSSVFDQADIHRAPGLALYDTGYGGQTPMLSKCNTCPAVGDLYTGGLDSRAVTENIRRAAREKSAQTSKLLKGADWYKYHYGNELQLTEDRVWMGRNEV